MSASEDDEQLAFDLDLTADEPLPDGEWVRVGMTWTFRPTPPPAAEAAS